MTAEPATASPPVPQDPWLQRGRLALVVGVAVLAVVGLGAVGFFLFRTHSWHGSGLAIVLGLIPLPLVALFYWWLDRYEPEPLRYALAAFAWGAVGAVAISIGLEAWSAWAFDLSDQQSATFAAPLVEESAKGVFLLATFLRARRVIGGVLDGIFYAGVVALGFAFVENIGYYTMSYLGGPDLGVSGAQGAVGTFVVRGVASPFAHPLFTSCFGIALGLAVAVRPVWARVPIVAGGWLASVLMHGLWNGSISYVGPVAFALFYLVLMVVFAGYVTLSILLRRRQFVVACRSLSYMAQRGWIEPHDIAWLTWFGYRAQAQQHAFRAAGPAARDAVRRYQRLATELAFVHDAVMLRRPVVRGIERTRFLRSEIEALRPGLILPQSIDPLPAWPVWSAPAGVAIRA
ncbi:MAG: PrsW family intramembrane metalloprotease [Aeromicrobium sp.]|uniref:PrsW family intramembrane metalloprotease n=1 Tax=Aeromicrobium sp. TaxID=1871063 RepID=UPI0039E7207A